MTSTTAGRIVVVCTGNVCRSPYIEHLLRRELDHVWGQGRIIVGSAGTHGLVGQPIDPGSAAQLGRRGESAADFRARRLSAGDIADADLVITATREHRSAVVRMSPTSLRRTATFAEVALAADVVPTMEGAVLDLSAAFRGVAAAIVAHRPALVELPSQQLDLDDPYGLDATAYAQMSEDVDRWLPRVVSALSPNDAVGG